MPGEQNENPAEAAQAAPMPEPQTPDLPRQAIGFDVPGGLEVADDPGSKEFLERQRQQTQQNASEAADVQESSGQLLGSDGGGFKELLEEANLSMRHVRFCCGGFLIVGMVALAVWGGIRWVGNLTDPVKRAERVEEKVAEQVEEIAEEVEKNVEDAVEFVEAVVNEVISDANYVDATLIPGILSGQEVKHLAPDPATLAGEIAGEALVDESALAQLIRDFSEIYEAMQVNVVHMIDQSRNRQQAYDDYVTELNYLLYVGRQNVLQLEEESERLVTRFTHVEDEKAEWEERFFEDMRNLDAYGSVNALDQFIINGEEVVQLRADYLARQKLLEYYRIVLEEMELRVTDLEFNEEALVKGVRVVDLEGSDIDLIITEDEL